MNDRTYTSKQMGDACEMLVAAELTLAGIPAIKAPESWPDYDVVAQPTGGQPLRISVKSRTFKRGPAYLSYSVHQDFDWVAIVLLNCDPPIPCRFFLIPKAYADEHARRNKPSAMNAHECYWRVDEVEKKFSKFENNFLLDPNP
ncbi:MAG: hypothetical protein KJZ73_16610 [Pseudorhodoplanes sp.]|nr:hypothetical protein [Pseudorhodoplanes sp.]